jgi:hypothetical protein
MIRSFLTLSFLGCFFVLYGQNNFQRVYNVDPDHHTKNQASNQLNTGTFVSLDLLEDTLRNAANDLMITLLDKKGGAASRSQNQGARAFRMTSLSRKHIFLPQKSSITSVNNNFIFTALLNEENKLYKVFGSLRSDGILNWFHRYLPSTGTNTTTSPFILDNFNNKIFLGTNHQIINRPFVSIALSNESGLLEWSKVFRVTKDSISGPLLRNILTDLNITNDTTIAISGYVSQDSTRLPFLLECDTLGNPVLSKIYFDTLDTYFITENVETVKLQDSTFVFAGSVDSLNSVFDPFGYVVKTDTSGNVVWARKLNFGESKFTKLLHLTIGRDNKIVVTGIVKDSVDAPFYNWMAKLSLAGNLEFVKTYPKIKVDDSIPGSLVSAMDNGYALFSTVDDGDNYLNLIKTDVNGKSTCESDSLLLNISPLSLTSGELFWVVQDTAKVEKSDVKTSEYVLNLPIITLERDPVYCPKDTINHLFDATVEDAVYYEWSTGVKGDSASMIRVMDTEQYSVIATLLNDKECFTLCDTAQLRRYATPIAQISYSLGDFCTTGLVTLTVNFFAEAGIKSISWSTGATTNQIKVGTAGIYAVTITDKCDEVYSTSFDLMRMPEIVTSVYITENFGSVCQTGNGVLEAIDNSFGLLPKQFEWSNGGNTQVINIAQGGNYCVTVTDICGNTASSCINIDEAKFRRVQITNVIVDETNKCVNGTVIAEVFYTGDANILWSTGETSKTIVIGVNQGPVTVTVSDKICPDNKDSEIVPIPTINFLQSIDIDLERPVECINDEILLTVRFDESVLSLNNANILWSTGETTRSIKIMNNGTYSVTVTQKDCAINTNSATLNFEFPLPFASIEPDSSSLCENGTILLTLLLNDDNAPINNPQYIWSTGATTSSIIINQNGIYSVTVSDPQCLKNKTSTQFEFTFPDARLRFASAFFPATKDTVTLEYNATFGPYLGNTLCPESIKDYEFYIYNRWGQNVFSTTKIDDEWNGNQKNEEEGNNSLESYIWAVKYSLFGYEYEDHGEVLLLRP